MKKLIVITFLSLIIIGNLLNPLYAQGNLSIGDLKDTLEANFPTKTDLDAAIAAIPTPSVNKTITVTAGEALTTGEIISLINSGEKLYALNSTATDEVSASLVISPTVGATTIDSSANVAEAYSTTNFVVVWRKADLSALMGVVCSISGDTLTINTPVSLVAARRDNPKIAFVDSSHFFVVSDNASTHTKIMACTVSGTTITYGAESNVNDTSGYQGYYNICKLNSTNAFLIYRDYSGVYQRGEVRTATHGISSDTVTLGTALEITTSILRESACCFIETDHVYAAYSGDSYAKKAIFTNSSGTMTKNTEYDSGAFLGDGRHACALLDTSKVIWGYERASDSHTQVQIDTTNTSTDTISSGTAYEITTENEWVYRINPINTSSAWILTNGRVVRATGTSSLAFDYNSTLVAGGDNVFLNKRGINATTGLKVFKTFNTITPYDRVVGISQGTFNLNNDATILISGMDSNQSGLLTGYNYYVNESFSLQTTPVSLDGNYIKMGIAKSSTEIILD